MAFNRFKWAYNDSLTLVIGVITAFITVNGHICEKNIWDLHLEIVCSMKKNSSNGDNHDKSALFREIVNVFFSRTTSQQEVMLVKQCHHPNMDYLMVYSFLEPF